MGLSGLKCGLLLTVYFALSFVMCALEGWKASDALYQSIIVMSTVGYGDGTIASPGGRLFMTFYSIFAFVVLAVAFNSIYDLVVTAQIERVQAALHAEEGTAGLFDKNAQRAKTVKRFFVLMASSAFFVALSIIIFVSTSCPASEECAHPTNEPFVDALYFTIITLTTVGFGDISPGEDWDKAWVVFLILFGIPTFGGTLISGIELLFGQDKVEHVVRKVKGLTEEKFLKMEEFSEQLEKIVNTFTPNMAPSKEGDSPNASVGADGKITRFEFLCFMLVANDIATMDDLGTILANFKELDAEGGGSVDMNDVHAWATKKKGEGNLNPKTKMVQNVA